MSISKMIGNKKANHLGTARPTIMDCLVIGWFKYKIFITYTCIQTTKSKWKKGHLQKYEFYKHMEPTIETSQNIFDKIKTKLVVELN